MLSAPRSPITRFKSPLQPFRSTKYGRQFKHVRIGLDQVRAKKVHKNLLPASIASAQILSSSPRNLEGKKIYDIYVVCQSK